MQKNTLSYANTQSLFLHKTRKSINSQFAPHRASNAPSLNPTVQFLQYLAPFSPRKILPTTKNITNLHSLQFDLQALHSDHHPPLLKPLLKPRSIFPLTPTLTITTKNTTLHCTSQRNQHHSISFHTDSNTQPHKPWISTFAHPLRTSQKKQ